MSGVSFHPKQSENAGYHTAPTTWFAFTPVAALVLGRWPWGD